jgi:hypothetical protein
MHLKAQFEELHRVLQPSLVAGRRGDGQKTKKNASAFLQGARGSGKSLVLEACLAALRQEGKSTGRPDPFRVVRLHGILVPGSNVALCVQEILRQLTDMSDQDSQQDFLSPVSTSPEETTGSSTPPRKRRRKKSKRTEQLARLRKTSFTNQIQLLNEILQFASLDSIPILFILDELDAFVGGSSSESLDSTRSAGQGMDRQLLLYHLLDRVATDSSLISFVGLTCHNGTMGLLEKRIRSRAEGTTRFIYFGPLPTFAALVELLGSKLVLPGGGGETEPATRVHEEWKALVSPAASVNLNAEQQQIVDCFSRSYNLGYSVRWFFRVVSSALALYRYDLLYGTLEEELRSGVSKTPSLQTCLFQSLGSMAAPLLTASGERNLVLVDKVAVNPRIQGLRDLSGPQLALVLAARRILIRDSHRENAVPLSLDRVLEEYKTYKGNSNRYSRNLLWVAFRDLLSTGLVRPGTDHTGLAPLQYQHEASFVELTAPTVGKIPLHLNLDIHRELQKAMDLKLLDCSAALQEWGKKTT